MLQYPEALKYSKYMGKYQELHTLCTGKVNETVML
jgi:hypothetical protein